MTSAESFHATQSKPSNTPIAPAFSTIARLERAVLAELGTIEAMRAAMGTLPQKPAGAAPAPVRRSAC